MGTRTGHSASIFRSANQGDFESTACDTHTATLVAEGASRDKWKPTTHRVHTSMASVSQAFGWGLE